MDRDTCEHFTPAGLPCEACASAAQVTRPPTPVGWSDTDWIEHLQEQRKEQKEPHPLLANAAFAWWESRRPVEFSIADHIQHPTVNCSGEPERALARAVAALLD